MESDLAYFKRIMRDYLVLLLENTVGIDKDNLSEIDGALDALERAITQSQSCTTDQFVTTDKFVEDLGRRLKRKGQEMPPVKSLVKPKVKQ